ncbi:MAG: SAVED domain-containing protein [Erythrobacter sp.]|nr:SAVED domain-containing protein [Erythrobacter sp.]
MRADPNSRRDSRSDKLRNVTRHVIWARGAGRCHICNQHLIGDLISGKEDANFAFIAHIVAATPTGPRGHPTRSSELADDPENLMLLCYVHHKLIDTDAVDDFPVERLLEIKEEHERRVSIQTGIAPDRGSQILRYAANVGVHRVTMPHGELTSAMLPGRYPEQGRSTIDLAMRGSAREDGEEQFWAGESENLRRLFARRVAERIDACEIRHLSVFALAPQPLLVLLGSLLGDIMPADVFQRHREPETWTWPDDGERMPIQTGEPDRVGGPIALKIALSANVDDSRIRSVLGDEAAIWSITTPHPHNDVLQRREDLQEFRRVLRQLYDRIKVARPGGAEINLFPAMPVATAVEVGRVRMPKADLPLVTWDENRALGGFRQAITIR